MMWKMDEGGEFEKRVIVTGKVDYAIANEMKPVTSTHLVPGGTGWVTHMLPGAHCSQLLGPEHCIAPASHVVVGLGWRWRLAIDAASGVGVTIGVLVGF